MYTTSSTSYKTSCPAAKKPRSWFGKELCLSLASPPRSVKQLSRGSKVHKLAVVAHLFRRPENARLTASTTRALLSVSIHEKGIIQLLLLRDKLSYNWRRLAPSQRNRNNCWKTTSH